MKAKPGLSSYCRCWWRRAIRMETLLCRCFVVSLSMSFVLYYELNRREGAGKNPVQSWRSESGITSFIPIINVDSPGRYPGIAMTCAPN